MNQFRIKSRGFTLIELMITVAIVGILAAIAYPSYQDQIRKSHRTDGKTKLLEVAQRQERYYTDNNTYATDLTLLGYSIPVTVPVTVTFNSDNGYYSISAAAGTSGSIASSYVLTATPDVIKQPDTTCGWLTLSNTGVKSAYGGTGCW